VKPYLKKNPSEKRAGGVAQGVGPEFKPQLTKEKINLISTTAVDKLLLKYAIILWLSKYIKSNALDVHQKVYFILKFILNESCFLISNLTMPPYTHFPFFSILLVQNIF
jgi:hypothetical protein